MRQQPILAAVDLGSNSFRLQVARVEGDQLYMLDDLREPVRLAAGFTLGKFLDAETQQRSLVALGSTLQASIIEFQHLRQRKRRLSWCRWKL